MYSKEEWILDSEGYACSLCGKDVYHCRCKQGDKLIASIKRRQILPDTVEYDSSIWIHRESWAYARIN